MSEYRPFSSQGWRGLVAPQGESLPLDDLTDWLQSAPGTTVRSLRLRRIARLSSPEGENAPALYLKVLWGLGDDREKALASLKWRFRSSLALKILRVHRDLESHGFLAPRVLLAARFRPWRPWGRPVDLLVTQEAPGRLLADCLCGSRGGLPLQGEARQEMLLRLGHELARLHKAGFVHGDCHPGNYLWTEGQDGFCYIDNDRTRLYKQRHLPGAIRNIVSAGFYLLGKKHLPQEEWETILQAYQDNAEFTPGEKREFLQGVASGVEKRLKRGK